MKKLEKMSFTDLEILKNLAEKEFKYWERAQTEEINDNEIEIAREQSNKFFLFCYHIDDAIRKNLYKLAENYDK